MTRGSDANCSWDGADMDRPGGGPLRFDVLGAFAKALVWGPASGMGLS